MLNGECSFWNYKVCADIRGGSLENSRRTTVVLENSDFYVAPRQYQSSSIRIPRILFLKNIVRILTHSILAYAYMLELWSILPSLIPQTTGENE